MKKSGCIIFSKDKSKVALIYRDYRNDYTFPKGHIEENESIIECAIRETEEETKIKPIINDKDNFFIEKYKSQEGNIEVYYYIAYYGGLSNNKSNDTHDVIWVKTEDVFDKLTYQSTKEMWNKIIKE